MNNVTFFAQQSTGKLLTEENTADFTHQSRNLTERRRSSLTPDRIDLQLSSRSKYKSFSFDHLSSIVQDLFVAGTETISNTLDWAILYATFFPDMQLEIQREIDSVLGKEKLPTDSDRFKLPYIEAFINETMRFHCAGPILVPKSTTQDVCFNGFNIPVDTFVMVNMWSVMRDPNYWEEPNEFDPTRFIKDGKFSCTNPAMMPFSIGKRACTGEALARLQLFLIFTSLLQKFSFRFVNEKDYENRDLLRGVPGIGLYKNQDISFKLRLR